MANILFPLVAVLICYLKPLTAICDADCCLESPKPFPKPTEYDCFSGYGRLVGIPWASVISEALPFFVLEPILDGRFKE